jgi:hypothetical protein
MLVWDSYVPEVLLSTIEPHAWSGQTFPIVGRGQLIEARVCRAKPQAAGEADARAISEAIPFLEYELHRQLLYKLRVMGMNAVFSLRLTLTVGDNLIAGLATGTAIFSPALPLPPLLQIKRFIAVEDAEDAHLVDVQRRLMALSAANRSQWMTALRKWRRRREREEEEAQRHRELALLQQHAQAAFTQPMSMRSINNRPPLHPTPSAAAIAAAFAAGVVAAGGGSTTTGGPTSIGSNGLLTRNTSIEPSSANRFAAALVADALARGATPAEIEAAASTALPGSTNNGGGGNTTPMAIGATSTGTLRTSPGLGSVLASGGSTAPDGSPPLPSFERSHSATTSGEPLYGRRRSMSTDAASPRTALRHLTQATAADSASSSHSPRPPTPGSSALPSHPITPISLPEPIPTSQQGMTNLTNLVISPTSASNLTGSPLLVPALSSSVLAVLAAANGQLTTATGTTIPTTMTAAAAQSNSSGSTNVNTSGHSPGHGTGGIMPALSPTLQHAMSLQLPPSGHARRPSLSGRHPAPPSISTRLRRAVSENSGLPGSPGRGESSSSSDSDEDEIIPLDESKQSFILQIDDEADEDVMATLLEPLAPMGISFCNTEVLPGLAMKAESSDDSDSDTNGPMVRRESERELSRPGTAGSNSGRPPMTFARDNNDDDVATTATIPPNVGASPGSSSPNTPIPPPGSGSLFRQRSAPSKFMSPTAAITSGGSIGRAGGVGVPTPSTRRNRASTTAAAAKKPKSNIRNIQMFTAIRRVDWDEVRAEDLRMKQSKKQKAASLPNKSEKEREKERAAERQREMQERKTKLAAVGKQRRAVKPPTPTGAIGTAAAPFGKGKESKEAAAAAAAASLVGSGIAPKIRGLNQLFSAIFHELYASLSFKVLVIIPQLCSCSSVTVCCSYYGYYWAIIDACICTMLYMCHSSTNLFT